MTPIAQLTATAAMLVTANGGGSSTPTPGSTSSASNTLEPSGMPPSHNHFHAALTGGGSVTPQHYQNQQQQQLSSANNSRPPSRAPSILDSPTLARVERARLRLEAAAAAAAAASTHPHQQQQQQQQQQLLNGYDSNMTTMNRDDSLERSLLDPMKHSLLAGRIPVASMTGPIKRGLLWQQRDRLFSRWKERYFVLTRDYLHCFKRASGSANERASDMGQFIFKVKLVDVEKVEWLNRRSYSAIGLLLGREGRVLLRCDDGLEDWFELLEECTQTSKERRRALKIAQGPRSRASLAAPVSHASLQSNHFGLGGTYSTALDDWLMTNGSGAALGAGRQHKLLAGSVNGFGATNPFLFSDSVPDLSVLNNENHNNHHLSGISTNHSTPQRIPYSSAAGMGSNGNNMSRYSNGYASQNNSFTNCTGLYGSPRRIFINSNFGSNHIVDEESEEGEVQLRRPRFAFRAPGNNNNNSENGNELDREWLYRKPKAPTEMRHSVQPMLPTNSSSSSNNSSTPNANSTNTPITTDLDCSGHDSGLDTPPSTHRPSSYFDTSLNGGSLQQQPLHHQHPQQQPATPGHTYSHASPRDSMETTGSSSRGTLLNSPGGSFRAKHMNHIANLNQVNALHGSRLSVQERILKIRNEEDRCASIKSSATRLNELYDPNQNRYYKAGSGMQSPVGALTPQHTPHKIHAGHAIAANNASNNNNGNGSIVNGSAIFRERYQHPALTAIINESQGMKFRDRSYSDCQQLPPRRNLNNNNNINSPHSPLLPRRHNAAAAPHYGTPTRV